MDFQKKSCLTKGLNSLVDSTKTSHESIVSRSYIQLLVIQDQTDLLKPWLKSRKNTLERCKRSGSDPHVAMLMYRATPIRNGMPSPAELLNQRNLKTTLPAKITLSHGQKQAREVRERQQQEKKAHHDKRAQQYRELTMYQDVYAQINPDRASWTPATIVETPSPSNSRRYKIQLPSGKILQRNRRYLRPDHGTKDATPEDEPNEVVEVRRSTRERMSPKRLHYAKLGGDN